MKLYQLLTGCRTFRPHMPSAVAYKIVLYTADKGLQGRNVLQSVTNWYCYIIAHNHFTYIRAWKDCLRCNRLSPAGIKKQSSHVNKHCLVSLYMHVCINSLPVSTYGRWMMGWSADEPSSTPPHAGRIWTCTWHHFDSYWKLHCMSSERHKRYMLVLY